MYDVFWWWIRLWYVHLYFIKSLSSVFLNLFKCHAQEIFSHMIVATLLVEAEHSTLGKLPVLSNILTNYPTNEVQVCMPSGSCKREGIFRWALESV